MPSEGAFKHGTRARYVAGCRCGRCTHANTLAYHDREARAKEAAMLLTGPARTETHCVGVDGAPCPRGTKLRKDSTGNLCMKCRRLLVWNGTVDAKPARKHIRELSKRGVGYKSVAEAACVSINVIAKIMDGRRKRVRSNTSNRILEVDTGAIADHALVDAKPVWDMVLRLMNKHDFTKGQISARIGQGGRALQLGRNKVTARNAHKIKQLLRDAEGDFLKRG